MAISIAAKGYHAFGKAAAEPITSENAIDPLKAFNQIRLLCALTMGNGALWHESGHQQRLQAQGQLQMSGVVLPGGR